MAKPMSKSDLISKLAEENSDKLSRKDVKSVLESAGDDRLQGAEEDRHVPAPRVREVRGDQEARHQGAEGNQPVHQGTDGLQGQARPQGAEGPPGQGRQRRGLSQLSRSAPQARLRRFKRSLQTRAYLREQLYISAGMDGLARRYQEVRRQTDLLAEPLSAEDCQVQSMPDASPTKWHLAHTSWFFETFVLEGAPLEPSFDYLFNSYYEAVGPRHPRAARGLLSRPSLDEVRALSPAHRRAGAGGAGARHARRGSCPRRAGPAARAATPGADPHRHQAPPRRPTRRARLPPPARRPRRRRQASARRRSTGSRGPAASSRSASPSPGRERRAVRVRQREPAAPGVAAPACARVAPGHLRRIPRLHQRRRLSPPRAVAVGRVGRGGRRAPRPPAVLARRRRSSRSTASGR